MNKKIAIVVLMAALLTGVWLLSSKKSVSPETTNAVPEVMDPVTSSNSLPTTEETKVEEAVVSPQGLVSDEDAFNGEIDAVEKSLPTLELAKTWTEEEVHHAPKEVIDGGKSIGRIMEKAQAAPAQRKAAMDFFLRCAENSELLPSIRAVCWRTTTDKFPEWKIPVPLGTAKVPVSVKTLATKL